MNDNQFKSTLGGEKKDEGLEPDASLNPLDNLSPDNEERAIDVGESGQFAPGGRYNELGVTSPRRLDLDEQVDSALRNEDK